MGTFEELPIELQISIMDYAVGDQELYMRGRSHLLPFQLTRCENEVHTPTSSYLKYDEGWLQTVYDFNNNAYEPNLRIACDY